jgi:hypothetical protein
MYEVTINKLTRVRNLIADFHAKKIKLGDLVEALEGTIQSMEEPLPKEFLSTWQDASINLEIIHRLEEENISEDKIDQEVERLETLILDLLDAQTDETK